MAIEFCCEHCGKLLTTSDDKAGWKARCPQCGDVLVVPTAEFAGVSAPQAEAHDETTQDRHQCPLCGMTLTASERHCPACGESVPWTKSSGRQQPRRMEAGEVLSAAWSVFGQHFGLLVVANLLVALLLCVAVIITVSAPLVMLALLDGPQKEQAYGLFLAAITAIPCLLAGVYVYLAPGLARIFLGVSRGEQVTLNALFTTGTRCWGRALMILLGYYLLVGLGLMLCVLPGIMLMLRFWPVLYVLVDEDLPALECFSRSAEITRHNWETMLLLGILSLLIELAAQLLCGLLIIAIHPLMMLVFSTAYVKLAGQEPVFVGSQR